MGRQVAWPALVNGRTRCRKFADRQIADLLYTPPQWKVGIRYECFSVDDDVRVRETLRSILKAYSNIEVVGEAGDGDEAVTRVGTLRPAVVVMDITMKKMDGITAARLIKAQYPTVLVVGCSAHTKEYNVYAMQRVQAFEVLLKKEDAADDLYPAIQMVMATVA